MPTATFAPKFIESMAAFLQEHPAYLALISAPISIRSDLAKYATLKVTIEGTLKAKYPSLSEEQRARAAGTILEITRTMMKLYAEASSKSKRDLVLEFQKLLTCYMEAVL